MQIPVLSFGSFAVDSSWWIEALPSFILKTLIRFSLITESSELRFYEPQTWWEWICSWFGFYPYDVIKVYQINTLNVLLTCVGLLALVALAFNAIVLTYSILHWSVSRTGSLIVVMFNGYLSAISCVFRLLASYKDSGQPIAETVVSAAASYLPESLVDGSPLQEMERPSCQVSVGHLDNDVFRAYGCAIRLRAADKHWLLMPMHVWAPGSDVIHLAGKSSSIPFHKNRLPDPDSRPRTVHLLDTDIAVIEVSETEMSKLGVAIAKILSRVPPNGAMASITGAHGKGSLGVIQPDPTSFGCISYAGSTVGGFSGAAYMVGNLVAGMHYLGGRRNLGYSVRLAFVSLLSMEKMREESSEDFLTGQIKERKKRVWVDETWGGLDEVRIQLDGEYHIVNRITLATIVGRDRELRGWLTYECDESNLPSGNGQAGQRPGGSPALTSLTQENDLKNLVSNIVHTAVSKALSPKKQKKSSGGQTTTQTQQTPSLTTQNTTSATA